MARPQKPKIFQMDVEISTTEQKVGAYTIEHIDSGSVYHGSTGHLYRRVIEHQKDLRSGKHANLGKYMHQRGLTLAKV
jgi:predicted GIY-YIG superfamily endonuclease